MVSEGEAAETEEQKKWRGEIDGGGGCGDGDDDHNGDGGCDVSGGGEGDDDNSGIGGRDGGMARLAHWLVSINDSVYLTFICS